ncbi:zinc-binding dehydrogenase [Spirosoma sp. 209]|uniref:quinone oxidoreductase family protein n=1 Tax=Spirosoma sp. 209 TaxID=1955701 RepID=UPI00098D4A7F|nr:zinc-binding dehydrogenase [Spirosoma sp. 209]
MTNIFKQIVITEYGSPEVLHVVETLLVQPEVGEVLIRVSAVGVNYSDILRRKNQYFQPTPLPYVLGAEAVGVVESIGPEVSDTVQPGTRVLAILPSGGGYGEYVRAPAQFCVPLPPSISDAAATGIFVQGSTAQLMVSQLAKEIKGKTVLITAAAGGIGSLLVQLAKQGGATVIAAASSEDKLTVAKALGADVTVNYSVPQWGQSVREATQSKGVDIAFEMVGGTVYEQTIRSLAQGGHLIVYGCASGVQGQIHPEYFVDENITQSGFNLAFYITSQMSVWQEALGMVIGQIASGQLKIKTPKTFVLTDVAEAHRQIEARMTTGKVVLTA